jgi:hypothetical protein
LAEWAWVYLRNERGARLITGEVEQILERGATARASSSAPQSPDPSLRPHA